MKLKERFVLRSKEDEKKEAAVRKSITLCVLICAIVIPLCNDGVLYTVIEYTDGDSALVWLNLVLRYIMVIIRYACIFASYGAVAAGILRYGYKNFKTPPLFLILGTFLRYMVAQFGSLVFCYEHNVINSYATDIAAMGFGYFILMILDIVKDVVLFTIGCRFAKKVRDGLTRFTLPDCSVGAPKGGAFMKAALSNRFPVMRACLYIACVHAVFDVLSNFLSVTLTQLAADGLPGSMSQVLMLLPGYVLIIPMCAAGFLLSVIICFKALVTAPAKKT